MTPLEARTVVDLVACIDAGAKPRYILFWGHRPSATGALGPSCFSQWWPAAFDADGATFASAEHYMMWRKARLFGDEDRAADILMTAAPAEAKRLGREVRGYDEQTWVSNRWDIVVAGTVAKFGSDLALRSYLLGTTHTVLVEASPVDRIWGIGLAAKDAASRDPRLWPGLNLLGFALMEARTRLAWA